MLTAGWLPGAVVYGMPIGAPSQRPLPKSAFSPVPLPTLLIQASERAWTGSVSIRVFQTLSAGKIWQPPIVGGAAAGALAGASPERSGARRRRPGPRQSGGEPGDT